ncbi:MAG: BLUF domain-containing protein, partial [Pricia sp.]
MLYELTYESVAKDGLSTFNINELLKISRANNTVNDISGCLVYYNRRFIQILEGSQEAVQKLYQKIKKDKRHTQVRVMAENPIEKRT